MGFLKKLIDFSTLRSKTFWSVLAYRAIDYMGDLGVIASGREEGLLWFIGTVFGLSVVDRSSKIIKAVNGPPRADR
jgi:hypothetical protein